MSNDAMKDFSKKWDNAQTAVRKHESYSGFSVRNFKSLNTRDGQAFNCDLLFNGKKFATAENGGQGGPDDIRGINGGWKVECKEWQELCTLAAQQYEPEALVLDCILTDSGV